MVVGLGELDPGVAKTLIHGICCGEKIERNRGVIIVVGLGER
jgi:hypothetical protein